MGYIDLIGQECLCKMNWFPRWFTLVNISYDTCKNTGCNDHEILTYVNVRGNISQESTGEGRVIVDWGNIS